MENVLDSLNKCKKFQAGKRVRASLLPDMEIFGFVPEMDVMETDFSTMAKEFLNMGGVIIGADL